MIKVTMPEMTGAEESNIEELIASRNVRAWHNTADSMPPDDSLVLVTMANCEVTVARYFADNVVYIVADRTDGGIKAKKYDPLEIIAWMELPGAYIPG